MIYIIWAIPGGGKSYFGTQIAGKEMFLKHPRKVFSNYPIIYRQKPFILKRLFNLIPKPILTIDFNIKSSYAKKLNKKVLRFVKRQPLEDKIYSTYIWEDKYIYTGLSNSVIILDEAYRDFSSKESPKFSKDKHTFFATNRHNELDIYVIAQHPARIEVIIREMTNIFYFVTKWRNPITQKPLWFDVAGYLSEEDFKLRRLKTDMRFSLNHYWFRDTVANAYDTHYFRKDVSVSPRKWSDIDVSKHFEISIEDKTTEQVETEKWDKRPKKTKKEKKGKKA
jgi:hypothetical protein